MTKNQHRQFMRWLNEFADAREEYHMAGSRPTDTEAQLVSKQASQKMIHAEQKLVQLFNSINER